MAKISVITLCNDGYLPYTLNCLETIRRIWCPYDLKCFCIGKKAYDTLTEKNIKAVLIDDENNTNFQLYREGNWASIVQYKFKIIYDELLKNDFVLYTDGDIVYESIKCFSYLLSNIEDSDMLVQNDRMSNDNSTEICSGFMFIKSNQTTRKLFNPELTEKYKDEKEWGDQIYINQIKYNLKYRCLPLELFPNGKYFYTNVNKITPYMIHFNWAVGHQKYQKMKQYNRWFIDITPL